MIDEQRALAIAEISRARLVLSEEDGPALSQRNLAALESEPGAGTIDLVEEAPQIRFAHRGLARVTLIDRVPDAYQGRAPPGDQEEVPLFAAEDGVRIPRGAGDRQRVGARQATAHHEARIPGEGRRR